MEREKEAKLILTRNLMQRSPRLNKSEMLSMGYEEWAIDTVLQERGTELDKLESVRIQLDAQFANNVLEKLAAKKKSEATEMLVKKILEEYHIYTTRDDNKEEVWIYDNGIYVPNGKTHIKEITRSLLGLAYTDHIYREVLSKIEADSYIDTFKFFETKNKEEIAVRNGILNVFTKQLSDFTPSKIFFNKLPVIFDPGAICDVIDAFLEDILRHPEDRLVYYEIGGFALLKEYKYEKAFMFVGDGRNGKGKSLTLLKKVIGGENCYSLPLSQLGSENADVSGLFGKLLNLAGDIGYTDLKETALFKGLTGRDIVTIKRKYLSAITFENYAKFVFACNQLPMVYDLSKGFWDRWVLLEFPYYFATKEEFEKADEEKRKTMKLRDENIVEKISTDSQLSGLLNKFLEGLQRLLKNGDFSSTKGSEEIKIMWTRRANSFIAFCNDKIEADSEGKISKKEIRKRYSNYCKEHKLIGKSDNVIKRVLQEEFGASEEKISGFGGIQEYFWLGLKWK